MTLPDVAVGAVVAAMVTGFISLVALILGKEQKTSDFRQAWIDALRLEAAEVVSQFLAHAGCRSFGATAQSEAASVSAFAFRKGAATLKLRLNPIEDPSKLIIARIKTMEELMDAGDFDFAKSSAAADHLVLAVQPVLKIEWDRVRDGELWFRAAKIALIVLVAIAAFYLLASSRR